MNDVDSAPSTGSRGAQRRSHHGKLKQPKPKDPLRLDGATVFPTRADPAHHRSCARGKSVLELMVYDGSDNGEKVSNTLSVIGQPNKRPHPRKRPDPSTANDVMKSLTAVAGHVSYYDRGTPRAKDGEQTPVLRDVVRIVRERRLAALVLDYNDFVISGNALESSTSRISKAV